MMHRPVGLSIAAWAAVLLACHPQPAAAPPPAPPLSTVTILATSDVHGWMRARVDRGRGTWAGGLEALVGLWESREGLEPGRAQQETRRFLVLDAGDMWTGPPASTLTRGRPVVDIYSAIPYDAVVVGNHEFDFGVTNLREQAGRAGFPFLAANVSVADSGGAVPFLRPGVLVERAGVRVGIIGLAYERTPEVTFPPNVAGLEFGGYEPALRQEAERLLSEGAQVLVVVVHDGIEALRALAGATADLPIRVFLGGHTHDPALEVLERDPETVADDVILAVPRSKGRTYSRVVLSFRDGRVVAHAEQVVPVGGVLGVGAPTSELVATIAARAEAEVGPVLHEVVGVAREPIEVGDGTFSPLGVLVAESWLERVPGANLAITNLGGIRQPLAAGEVTVGDILGVLPFTNHLLVVEITGAQIKEVLANPSFIVGGAAVHAHMENGVRVVDTLRLQDGEEVVDSARYRVVTTDFLYAGGDGAPFARMDPDPLWLELGWREPVLDLFRSRGNGGVGRPSRIRGTGPGVE